MDFIENLAVFLLNNSKINSQVEKRIYPQILPQECQLPAIMYSPISVSFGNSLSKHTGFVRHVVQFSVYGETFGKARKLGKILRQILQDYKGDMNGTYIQATNTLTDTMFTNGTTANYNINEYVNILEFEFMFEEKL